MGGTLILAFSPSSFFMTDSLLEMGFPYFKLIFSENLVSYDLMTVSYLNLRGWERGVEVVVLISEFSPFISREVYTGGGRLSMKLEGDT